jgi:hypothetical protein
VRKEEEEEEEEEEMCRHSLGVKTSKCQIESKFVFARHLYATTTQKRERGKRKETTIVDV